MIFSQHRVGAKVLVRLVETVAELRKRPKDDSIGLDLEGGVGGSTFAKSVGLMRPGTWHLLVAGTRSLRTKRPVAAVREGVEVPAHVARAFTQRGTVLGQKLLLQAFEVFPTASQRTRFQADAWVPRHSSKWVFFDFERLEVLRWASEPYSMEYWDLRLAFERHVRSCPFSAGPSDDMLIEAFVNGRPLSDLEPAAGAAVRSKLLYDFSELVRHERRPPSAEAVSTEPLAAILERSPLRQVRDHATEILEMFDHGLPRVPTHGDLNESNVIVSDDGIPTVIDFGQLSFREFWRDPLEIAAQDTKTWAAGGLDDELGAVWEAAGLEPVAWDPIRVSHAKRYWFALKADRKLVAVQDARRKRDRRIDAAEGPFCAAHRAGYQLKYWKKLRRIRRKIARSARTLQASLLDLR